MPLELITADQTFSWVTKVTPETVIDPNDKYAGQKALVQFLMASDPQITASEIQRHLIHGKDVLLGQLVPKSEASGGGYLSADETYRMLFAPGSQPVSSATS